MRSPEQAAGGTSPRAGLAPPALAYVVLVAAVAAAAAARALQGIGLDLPGWPTFLLLTAAAGAAWLFLVPTGRNHGFHVATVFMIAGALLLPVQLVALLAVGQHLPDWVTRRYPWYIQTFNTANYTLNVLAAWGASALVLRTGLEPNLRFALAATSASLVMVALNHVLLATVLLLARGRSFRESGLFSAQSLSTDLVLAALGVAIAGFWQTNPWLIVTGIAPLVLIQRSFSLLARLRESEEQFRAVFDSSAMGIRLGGLDGRLVAANGALERMLGYDADGLAAHPLAELADPDDGPEDGPEDGAGDEAALAAELVAGRRASYQVERRFLRRDGGRLWGRVTTSLVHDPDGRPRFVLSMLEDVTGRKQLEEQLRQAQKLEAIGRLAGGIAHDFNNLLTVVETYSAFALQQIDDENVQLRSEIEEIRRAGERASALTRQLLALGRRQVMQPHVLDLNDVVADTNGMLRRLIGEHVEVETRLEPELGAVTVDRGQLEQVLMNLTLNARDAMPDGGRLTVETANVELEAPRVQNGVAAEPGSYVALTVSDTGCGMDEATLARILEPFFTTKERGKGSGLGLSTVYGIVDQSGGALFVESAPGEGTTVEVLLPRTRAKPQAAPEPEQAAEAAGGGRETVLLVEDEDGVRGAARRILRASGYRVLEAFDPVEALRVAKRHRGPIDLVVTDVVMPHMGGPKLVQSLGELWPDLKVLYISGYTDEEDVARGVARDDAGFLQKPFTPEALAAKVREMLDVPPAVAA